MLVNDRRIAENTIRIPHPYSLADAKEWIGSVRAGGEESFVVTVAGEVIGVCGCQHRDGIPEIGYWLGAPFSGNGYAT
jgi:RimJ/RimL family protein N-acetyltransferase